MSEQIKSFDAYCKSVLRHAASKAHRGRKRTAAKVIPFSALSVDELTCLYRVSTVGQVDKNDIPMQKDCCRDFAARQPNWTIIDEKFEKSVSGFKKSAQERDAVQELQREAVEGKFDVLLVFMFDRLGRRDDETPFIVEWFVKNGIEVWSAMEGSVPYGYRLEKRGRTNKRNKEVYNLVIDDDAAKIVQLIFYKYVHGGFGAQRLCHYLHEMSITRPDGSGFPNTTINRMIKNPIYTGYLHNGEARSAHIPELQIIDQATLIVRR